MNLFYNSNQQWLQFWVGCHQRDTEAHRTVLFDAKLMNFSPASLLSWDKNKTPFMFYTARLPLRDKNKITIHFLLKAWQLLKSKSVGEQWCVTSETGGRRMHQKRGREGVIKVWKSLRGKETEEERRKMRTEHKWSERHPKGSGWTVRLIHTVR